MSTASTAGGKDSRKEDKNLGTGWDEKDQRTRRQNEGQQKRKKTNNDEWNNKAVKESQLVCVTCFWINTLLIFLFLDICLCNYLFSNVLFILVINKFTRLHI